MEFKKLFIPGPSDVSPDVLAKVGQPMISHRKTEIKDLLESCVTNLHTLMYTQNQILISTSSATGLMEAGVRNCVGKKQLAIVNGAFSKRWAEIGEANGKSVDRLEVDMGDFPEPEVIDEKLSSGEYDALTMAHNETSTGVMAPLDKISKVMKNHPGVVWMVDCVSSMGGVKIPVDELGIDFAQFSVQKCMALPPGLACCSVSQKAMDRAQAVPNRGHYFDFLVLQKYMAKYNTPATPAIPQIYGLEYKLGQILNVEGQENRYQRHADMAKYTQDWAKTHFEMLPAREEIYSKTVSSIKNTGEHDIAALDAGLSEKGYVFSNGYGPMKNISFRVAHMGDRTLDELKTYLETIEGILGL